MLDSFKNKIKERLSPVLNTISEAILGKNQERLDYVLDSFYKLEPKQRTGVLAGLSVLLLSLFIFIFSLYFSRVSLLDESLNNHTVYLSEVKKLLLKKKVSDSEFSSLERQVKNQLASFSLKPFLERVSRESKVKMTLLNVRNASNPEEIGKLAKNLKEKHVEIRVQKVSLQRLLKFIELIEKPKKYVKIIALKINSNDKLYFNLELSLRAFQTT